MVMMRRVFPAAGVLAMLVGCGPQGLAGLDPDLRGLGGGGLDTAPAAAAAAPRPAPDSRGVISYPAYQVAIARQGETVASIAARLGFDPAELARYNAIAPDAVLTPGAVVALPRRVASAAAGAAGTGAVRDPFAGQAAGGAGAVTSRTLPAASQPRQHVVAAGETAWSIARKYNVSVNDLASWNGLPSSMAVRTGQRLLIPVTGGQAPGPLAAVTPPGTGSPTPRPPSAAEPLPSESTRPVADPVPRPAGPDLGRTRTAASGGGRFRMPANGAIIRPYEKGRNEGIDIAAAPGSPVSAAGAGTVAAITRDVDQVPIIVLRHDGGLMTVYAGLDQIAVTKGQTVSSGAILGKARSSGVVHFEVRNGFESADPEKYLN